MNLPPVCERRERLRHKNVSRSSQHRPARTCRVGTLGSFFGRGVVKKISQGVVVGAEVAPEQPLYAQANGKWFKCPCGMAFDHPPALTIHQRFCRGIGRPNDVSDNQGGEALHDPIDLVEVEAEEDDISDLDHIDNGGRPVKRRKYDGKPKQSGLRQGMKRTPHSLLFKFRVALEYEAFWGDRDRGLLTDPLKHTSEYFNGLSMSNIYNWWRKMGELKRQLTHETCGGRVQSNRSGRIVCFSSAAARRMTLHPGRGAVYLAAEAELYTKFKAERREGKRLNERYLCVNMRKLIRQHYGDEPADKFKASYGWVWRFARRHDISLRRATNHKHQSVRERLPKIKRWHARLRLRLKTGPPTKLDPKWGRWLPHNRLSIDQVCHISVFEVF